MPWNAEQFEDALLIATLALHHIPISLQAAAAQHHDSGNDLQHPVIVVVTPRIIQDHGRAFHPAWRGYFTAIAEIALPTVSPIKWIQATEWHFANALGVGQVIAQVGHQLVAWAEQAGMAPDNRRLLIGRYAQRITSMRRGAVELLDAFEKRPEVYAPPIAFLTQVVDLDEVGLLLRQQTRFGKLFWSGCAGQAEGRPVKWK
jgi:hypothetical protein